MPESLEINTERLILRSIRHDDARTIFRYRSDKISNQYQGWIPETTEDVYDFIKNKVSPTIDVTNTWHQFVIIKKKQNQLIGDIGIHFPDANKKQVELGCTLDKNLK